MPNEPMRSRARNPKYGRRDGYRGFAEWLPVAFAAIPLVVMGWAFQATVAISPVVA